MENKICKRLAALRKVMKKENIDAYYITTADFHNSEYVSDYFKVREFFSGFTGSNGNLLVTEDRAYLWTDGRYFVQAENELKGSGIELMKMGEDGVPDIYEFLKNNLKDGNVLGFDGRTVTASAGKRLKKVCEEAGGESKAQGGENSRKSKKNRSRIRFKKDITCDIFKRPAFPLSRAEVLSDDLCGEDPASKLTKVREKLREKDAEALLLTKLDDIMYLYNIRGNDVEYNPVLMSYAYISEDISVLFLQQEAVTADLRQHLDKADTMILDYGNIEKFIGNLEPKTRVMIDENRVNYSLYRSLKRNCRIISGPNPTEEMKAVKNETELRNMREIFLKDSAALTRFILRLRRDIGNADLTEVSAAEMLLGFRKEIPEFRELSFGTISAYRENAAMMHYEPGINGEVRLKAEGMLLVDSGAQYYGGTTDVTRTIVLGDISEDERHDYTLTACSMLNLLNLRWLAGCTGQNIDIIARKRLWDEGKDYKCGTGHGVGYILNVHEGPHNIRWRSGERDAELKSGMCVTDEPGVYRAGKYGIRIENVLVVKEDISTEDGQFLSFENLTFAPIDDKGIDRSLLTEQELKYYTDYQRSVCEAMKPYLTEGEMEELKEYTGQVSAPSPFDS